jgi:predicted molibdopterin-dependent oxidoreductase YjgC
MGILNKIGIKEDSKFTASIGSGAAVGKTILMLVIATELVKEGKNVLFVSDDRTSQIMRKADRFITNKKTGKLVVVGNFHNNRYPLRTLTEGRDFDYIFLDCFMFNEQSKFLETINLVKQEKFSTFVSVQLKRIIQPVVKADKLDVNTASNVVDYVFVLTRKETLNFFEKIKYWFTFTQIPNFNLNLIKSRFGKNNKFDFHIDFNKLK